MSKTYVKLKNVGDEATFTVTRCAPGTGKYPDVEFEDNAGNVYAVPKAPADRQLERLGIEHYPDVQGRTVKISRGENKQDASKPFWNLDLVSGAKGNGTGGASNGAAATTQPAATTQARPVTRQQVEQAFDAEPVEKEKASAIYKRMTQYVLDDVVPLYLKAGIEPNANDVHAMVSTLFINVQGRR